MLLNLLLLALAGAAGTLARYGVSTLTTRLVGDAFPWGTFVVNAAGCLVFGVVWAVTEPRLAGVASPQTRLVLLTGFMGAFTTFSTFAFESADLMMTGRGWLAAVNVAGQCVVGIALVLAGLALGRLAA